MQLAAKRLADRSVKISAVASEVGYESEAHSAVRSRSSSANRRANGGPPLAERMALLRVFLRRPPAGLGTNNKSRRICRETAAEVPTNLLSNLRQAAYHIDPAVWVRDVFRRQPHDLAGNLPADAARRFDPGLDFAPGRQDHNRSLGDRARHAVYARLVVGDCLPGPAGRAPKRCGGSVTSCSRSVASW